MFNAPPGQSSPKRKVYFIHLSGCECFRSVSIDQHKCVPADMRLWGLSSSATKVRLNRLKLNGVGSLPNPFSLSQQYALLCKSSQSSSKTTLALSSVSLRNRTQELSFHHSHILQDRQVHSSSRCLDSRATNFSTAGLPLTPAPGNSVVSDLHF